MLIFHEGMPGHGKSYSAVKDYLVPQLVKGRKVFARINGLNYPQIAALAEITEDRCRELLVEISEDQVKRIYLHVANDSFVIIDELQNFFPSERKPLDADMTKFVTEHRHLGIDMLLMGQVMNDCHATWRNRVDQKVIFQKRDALGKPDEFKTIVQKPVRDSGGRVKYQEVSSKVEKYDSKYFDAYASHRPDTENKETLTDSRANVFNSPVFKRVRGYAVVLVVALGFIIWAFTGGLASGIEQKPDVKKPVKTMEAKAAPGEAVVTTYKEGQPVAVAPAKVSTASSGEVWPSSLPDMIEDMNTKYRARLVGSYRVGSRVVSVIEWRGQDQALYQRFTTAELASLGWSVFTNQTATIAVMTNGEKRFIATSYPLNDRIGELSDRRQEAIRGQVQEPSRQDESRYMGRVAYNQQYWQQQPYRGESKEDISPPLE